MIVEEKIKQLRKKLRENNIDAYYITGSDAHLSEYVAPHWRTREFISGFTGSAGEVVITLDEAILWVDSRYFIQADAEIKGTPFKMLKLDTEDPDPINWMRENLSSKSIVSTEESEISIKAFKEMEKKLKESGIILSTSSGILSSIWQDRPSIPFNLVTELGVNIAGKSSLDKIKEVREILKEKGASWTFISSLDDIAWLTNLRSDDIPYNPVFYSFFFLSQDKAILFTNKKRFSSYDYPFEIREYEDAYSSLSSLIEGKGYFNDEKTSMAFDRFFKDSDLKARDITTDLKARKNDVEKEGMRHCHILDAASYINFLAKLDRSKETSEIEVSNALEMERLKKKEYLGPSFGPISGFSEHGAMCHYSATEESNKKIGKSGLLVLDTGGQYISGTTDITRTLLFGEATDEEKRDYTLVLKGHLALSRQRFIKGTRGIQLDVLAKQFLWQNGESYYHGTGHGVGCRLNVHEGPARISNALIDVALEPGMVISDEPGVYKEGRHGIRIENLIMVKEDIKNEFGTFYSFEVLTLVPYEKELIEVSMLTDEEISQINSYHKRIYETLKDKIDQDSLLYIEKATSPISRN